mgnify:CR=1 FL=1
MVTHSVVARRGRVTVGCLALVVLVGVFAFVASKVGTVYLRYYQFQDAFNQQAKFAASDSDDTIISRLRAKADSLDLPVEAQRVHVHRTSRGIVIWSQYADSILIPGVPREVDFTVRAEKAF